MILGILTSVIPLIHAQDGQYSKPHTIHFPKDCCLGMVTIRPRSERSVKDIINRAAVGDVEVTTESWVFLDPNIYFLNLDRWTEARPGDVNNAMQSLSDLDLSFSSVTSRGIRERLKLPNLKYLRISRDQADKETQGWLKTHRPGLTVFFKSSPNQIYVADQSGK